MGRREEALLCFGPWALGRLLLGEWGGFPWALSSVATVCLASQAWETLLPFPPGLPSSVLSLPWQLGRNLLKSHVCDSL